MASGRALRLAASALLALAAAPSLPARAARGAGGAKAPAQPGSQQPDLDQLVQVLGNRKTGDPAFQAQAMRGYVCSALAGNNTDLCAPMDALAGDAGLTCRWDAMLAAYLPPRTSPVLDGICRELVVAWKDLVRKGQEGEFCQELAVALRTHNPDAICGDAARFAPRGEEGAFSKGCSQTLAFLSGAQACRGVRGGPTAPVCRDFAYLAQAFPTQNKKLCRRSLLCEGAVSRSVAACDKIKRQAAREFMKSDSLSDDAAQLRDEIALRVQYGYPIQGAAHGSIGDLVKKEKAFREGHGYPPLRPGDQFLSTMSSGERQRAVEQEEQRSRQEQQ